MYITVEISFYPLDQSFGSQILDFIADLAHHEGVETRTNSMSTQITGEYEAVFGIVQNAVRKAFSKGIKAVVVMKMFNEELELEWLKLVHDH